MATNIDRPLLAALRTDISAALKAVAQKHGIELALGSCKFSPTNADFKLEVRAMGSDGVAVTKEMSDLRRMMGVLNLTDAHLTQVFSLGRDSYTLAGYRVKAQNKPFLMRRVSDDKVFICDEATILRALGVKSSVPEPLVITQLPRS
jgi:hypothetical protein